MYIRNNGGWHWPGFYGLLLCDGVSLGGLDCEQGKIERENSNIKERNYLKLGCVEWFYGGEC